MYKMYKDEGRITRRSEKHCRKTYIYIYGSASKESLIMGKSLDSCTHNAVDVEYPMSFSRRIYVEVVKVMIKTI